jgi:crotonobetainyl-CoA:carnitine CoA-transferase CaiB-like acyl-CoA transferase
MASFGRDLVKDLASECSGSFLSTLKALCLSSAEYDARKINNAIAGLGTNEDVITEIMCTRASSEIAEMDAEYQRMYGKSLEADIAGDTSGDLKKIYLALLNPQRCEGGDVEADVAELYKAGEGKFFGTNEDVLIRILCGCTREYREAVASAYAKAHGKSLDAAIESEMSGHAKKALAMLATPIAVVLSRALHSAMQGAGTQDRNLIRIIVSQRERHIKAINQRFLEDHQRNLATWVAADCSGDYKKLLLKVLEVFC